MWTKAVGIAPCFTSQQIKSVWVMRSRKSGLTLKHPKRRNSVRHTFCGTFNILTCMDALFAIPNSNQRQIKFESHSDGSGDFLYDSKHNFDRFTLNLHSLKIMIVESFP